LFRELRNHSKSIRRIANFDHPSAEEGRQQLASEEIRRGCGDASAQYNLGVMYDRGQGVMQNYVQPYMWFNLSAAQGNQIAE
jgi:TPR repeat protein